MSIRTTRKIVKFSNPFTMEGVGRVLPAGNYEVVTDEELIEGLSFPVYRRIATMMLAPAQSSQIEMLTIDPRDLAATGTTLPIVCLHDKFYVQRLPLSRSAAATIRQPRPGSFFYEREKIRTAYPLMATSWYRIQADQTMFAPLIGMPFFVVAVRHYFSFCTVGLQLLR